MANTYDPKRVRVTFNGIPINGHDSTDFVHDEDRRANESYGCDEEPTERGIRTFTPQPFPAEADPYAPVAARLWPKVEPPPHPVARCKVTPLDDAAWRTLRDQLPTLPDLSAEARFQRGTRILAWAAVVLSVSAVLTAVWP